MRLIVLAGLAVAVAGTAAHPQTLDCSDWNSQEFFAVATVVDVASCIAQGQAADKRDGAGVTPLHRAAAYSDVPQVLAFLINSGANPNAPTNDGETPLHIAAVLSGNPENLALLLDRGAKLEARDRGGRTPLHRASEHNNSHTVLALLLDRGAKLEARDGDGRTPIHRAVVENDNPRILTLLLDRGANPNARTINGKTAWDLVQNNDALEGTAVYWRLNALAENVISANFGAGMTAYRRGNYATAFRKFHPLAKQGHTEAQYYLGVLYLVGEGVRQDYAEATSWLRRAAEQRNPDAQYALGLLLFEGWGVPRDDAQAAEWFRKAAEQGHADADAWLRKTAEEGHADAQIELGVMLYGSDEGIRWLRRAAEQGHADAQFLLGYTHEVNAGARHSLGLLPSLGEGVEVDMTKAARWFRLAAEQGHTKAQASLGFMYYKGQGVERNPAEAARLLRLAAGQGNQDAQYGLGFMYYKGQGEERNPAEAARLLRLVGYDLRALYLLGVMHYEGDGVEQDFAIAAALFRSVAEAWSRGGYFIREMYHWDGGWQGVTHDNAIADAKFSLGFMYFKGQGVGQDDVLAYFWLDRANVAYGINEHDRAARRYGYEDVQDLWDTVRSRMTRSEIAEAQRIAAETSFMEPDPDRPNATFIQRALRRLGYDPGSIDGLPSPRMRQVIRTFQLESGLPVDGQISDALEGYLMEALIDLR